MGAKGGDGEEVSRENTRWPQTMVGHTMTVGERKVWISLDQYGGT